MFLEKRGDFMSFQATCSVQKGHGSIRHNDRSIENIDEKNRSWDPELVSSNVVHKNEKLKDVYHELFDDAVEIYNEKQIEKGHPERQIKNYYEKISHSKQEHLYYEIVVGIGNLDSIEKGSAEEQAIQSALRDYCFTFEERNPNFRVVQMIEHNDEEMLSHVHIDFVPFSTGNKRGLETKNSMGGALKEMGFTRTKDGFARWREHEQDHLIQCMERHGIEWIKGSPQMEHMKIQDYKMKKQEYAQEARKELEKLETPKPIVKESPITKKRTVTFSEAEYGDLMKEHSLEIESLKAEKETAELEKSILMKENNQLKGKSYVIENERLRIENADLRSKDSEYQAISLKNDELKEQIEFKDNEIQDLKKTIQDKDYRITVQDRDRSYLEKIAAKLWQLAQKAMELVPGFERLVENRIPLEDRLELDNLVETYKMNRSRSRGMHR